MKEKLRAALVATSFAFFFAGTAQAEQDPTFNRDIAPIVYQHCMECHRPNQAAPFSLITYEQVAKRARLSTRLIKSGEMPPWKPVPGHGEFIGERRLSHEQIELFQKWIDTGRKEGNPDDLPPLPKFPERWPLGEPDLIVKMAAPYSLPADGPDIYRNFVVPTGLDKEVWVRAVDVRPMAPRAVHHVLIFGDETGLAEAFDRRDEEQGFPEMMMQPNNLLGGYVPGAAPIKFPDGLSLHLEKGAPLVLQTHFHPTGKPETEQLEVGLYLTDKPSEKSIVNLQLPEFFGIGTGIDIPAGENFYEMTHEVTLPVDCEAIAVGGHAHYICREVELTAHYPDGKVKSIFYIDDWDLDWQGNYTYRTPEILPKGTVLKTAINYDNSAENSNNPFYPPQRIKWGKESTDEMGSITLTVVPCRESDAKALKKLANTERKTALVSLFRGGKAPDKNASLKMPPADEILKTFDTDKSGGLSSSEFPVSPAKDRFSQMDRNGDSQLDKKELNSMVQIMNLAMRIGMDERAQKSPIFRWVIKKRLALK